MEKKGTWGTPQSKLVTTKLPGSGAPQLQVLLPDATATSELGILVPGLSPRLMGMSLQSLGRDVLQPDAMTSYTAREAGV